MFLDIEKGRSIMKGKCTYFCQHHINIKYVYIFANRGGKHKTRIYNDNRFTANRDSKCLM